MNISCISICENIHAGVHVWVQFLGFGQSDGEDGSVGDVGQRQLILAVLGLDTVLAEQLDEELKHGHNGVVFP